MDTAVLDLPRSQWTLVEAVRRQARRLGDAEFLHFTGEQAGGGDAGDDRLTFAGLDERSDVAATALAALGVGPGDRVLALATNSAAFVVAMIATHKRRAVFTPVNTELKGAFLEHQVRNSEPVVILVDDELAPSFAQVDTSGVGVAHVVVIGSSVPDALPASLRSGTVRTWDELVAGVAADPAVLVDPEPSDICTIMYTSGTTGPSKGVLMPQAHCFLFGKGSAEAVGLREGDDRYFVCMPFFHANALFMQVYACLVAGVPATVVKRFSVSTWLDQVIDCGATATNALGVMPEFIFRRPPDPRDRSHRLTRVMAVPVGDEWGAAFEERFGVRLVQGFGMTEINMVAYSDPADPVMAGCAGRVLDEFFEVVVADPETDEPVPVGQAGEILVRPKVPFCFNQGYFRMPDKTVEAYRNLWFHTGDAGRFDDEGRLFFIDRLKDRIRRRGENISSYEIEQVLNEYPAVVESAAIGIRVEGAGGEEEIKAVLVLHPGAADGFDPVALLDFCVERMPRYAVPRFVELVDELDKTPSGKVRKQAARDAGVTPTTWDRESVGYTIKR
jgi:crotonobetaine/carnitine-CoA ligase